MKKRTKLTICLGVICALLVAISSWYTIAFNNSRFIVPMDLSEYVFRVQDLPMIISGVLLTLYIVNIVVLFLESIKTNRRRELTLQSTRTIRMIPEGSDAISPAPHHDIYSIEDLRQLIWSLKQATHNKKPVSVKIAAVHNVAAIASGVARAGADIVVIDGFRGGTGAAPTRIRDNVGIPIELALAAADQRLRDEGIRSTVSLVAAGSFRCSSDIVKACAGYFAYRKR